uniref:Uncharacterized protein n=1 Tax=Oryza glumipatula TaxID=40148 RepID=A0A0E0AXR0_9ORYZ
MAAAAGEVPGPPEADPLEGIITFTLNLADVDKEQLTLILYPSCANTLLRGHHLLVEIAPPHPSMESCSFLSVSGIRFPKDSRKGQMHVEQGIQSQDMIRVLSSEKVLKMQETHNVTGHGEGFKLRKGSEDAGDTQYKY